MKIDTQIVHISFPEIQLTTRAATQLRGFFGNYFREHSPLLHNHYDDGKSRYTYPLVQYKVLHGTPVLVGVNDGAQLLAELFFKMKFIRIGERDYPVLERDIAFRKVEVGMSEGLRDYQFQSAWMALNQNNYAEYQQTPEPDRKAYLSRILTGNILSFFKGMGLFLPPEARIVSSFRLHSEGLTGFKDKMMVVFQGDFTSNVMLPDGIGLGKAVSRGYGAIQSI